ncbi:MAG: hypothetical protein CMH55_08500 [Myxococcales bacterium]|nr:hypothetical protein [Myxococcales bacterium]
MVGPAGEGTERAAGSTIDAGRPRSTTVSITTVLARLATGTSSRTASTRIPGLTGVVSLSRSTPLTTGPATWAGSWNAPSRPITTFTKERAILATIDPLASLEARSRPQTLGVDGTGRKSITATPRFEETVANVNPVPVFDDEGH